MAKAKQNSQPSAEVIPILHASCSRLQKLLALCEAELTALIGDSNTSAASRARQIQILSRTIQGLQRDWLKYMAMLHPDVPVIPSSKPARKITTEKLMRCPSKSFANFTITLFKIGMMMTMRLSSVSVQQAAN